MPKIIKNLQEKIFENAKELFYEDGYEGVDMKTIAKRCDIAVGTLYNYYPNKDSLYIDVIKKSWESTFNKLESLKNSEVSTREKVRKFITVLYDDIKERRGIGFEILKLSNFQDEITLNLKKFIKPIEKISSFNEDEFINEKLVYIFLSNIVILIKAFPDKRDDNLKCLYHMLSSFMVF